MADLKFYSWRRSGIYDLPTTLVGGRLRAVIDVTISDRSNPGDQVTRAVPFQITGPADVTGFDPSATGRMAPTEYVSNAEITKAVHVEFRAPDLPWRYTPQAASGDLLRPFIVLLVGTNEEIVRGADGTATITASVLSDYDLTESARWAHLDETSGVAISRLISLRRLNPHTDYLAVVVPAFANDGSNAWDATAASSLSLPVYHSWTFSTGEEGDFVSLAAALRPRLAPAELGRAPLHYDRIAPTERLEVRGALAPIGGTDVTLPTSVGNDLMQLRITPTDPRGRTVITIPTYGTSWYNGTSPVWSDSLNNDPRNRVPAGLGLWAAIEKQELIAESVTRQAGEFDAAAQRLRNLALGLAASRSLWRRRLPSDSMHRLLIFGVSSRRLNTPAGSLHARMNQPDRPLPPVLFSTAARRILRSGPARTRFAAPGANRPRDVLESANQCPPPPDRAPDGLPHGDPKAELEQGIKEGVNEGKLDPNRILEALSKLDLSACSPQVQQLVLSWINRLRVRFQRTGEFPFVAAIDVLIALSSKPKPDDVQVAEILEGFDFDADGGSVIDFAKDILTQPPNRPCRPLQLEEVSKSVDAAIDPTVESPLAVTRVTTKISGLEASLLPPRFCPTVDLPMWRFLRDDAPDWLLPGLGQLQDNAVTAVTTNPLFVDALMVGVNSQILAELHWRNIGVASQCTPARVFWDRISVVLSRREDDIVGIEQWPAASTLGASSHQAPSESSRDLVIVFRTPLFHRYPETLVYLAAAPIVGGEPDWDQDPDFSQPLYPVFQGKVGSDVVFFGFDIEPIDARRQWLVLDQPPASVRFRNRVATGWPPDRINRFNNANNGADFADAAFEDPTRVLIRGVAIIPEA